MLTEAKGNAGAERYNLSELTFVREKQRKPSLGEACSPPATAEEGGRVGGQSFLTGDLL